MDFRQRKPNATGIRYNNKENAGIGVYREETLCFQNGKPHRKMPGEYPLTWRVKKTMLLFNKTVEQVPVTGPNRESGANPERTRHCDSELPSGMPLGDSLRRRTEVMTSSQETCLRRYRYVSGCGVQLGSWITWTEAMKRPVLCFIYPFGSGSACSPCIGNGLFFIARRAPSPTQRQRSIERCPLRRAKEEPCFSSTESSSGFHCPMPGGS